MDTVLPHATEAVVERLDGLQYELDEGPCITAWADRTAVRREDRWPRWTPAAAATGMRAVLSAPLVAGDEALVALKVYSHRPDVYHEHDEHLSTMFAAHSAVLLAHVRSCEDARRTSEALRSSLRARDIVNMAKRVLMAREGVDEPAAFLLLSTRAEQERRSVPELAESLLGTIPRRLR